MPRKPSWATPKTRKRIVGVPELTDYMRIVKHDEIPVCHEQKQLVALVERVFATEKLTIDMDRLNDYKGYEELFPFRLFPLEWFMLTLWLCVFRADGLPRFPDLFWYTGRGSGKNGFISFCGFCMITKANGIPLYHVDICANSEDQAKTSFDEISRVLDANAPRTSKGFHWTKEVIESKSTRSELRYRTSNPKTKDGGQPGCVIFDEEHAYENRASLEVFNGGLGKKRHPRTGTITTDGDIRGGVLDEDLETARAILDGKIPDNGMLPVLCRLDSDEELHDEAMWAKAIPRLPYAPIDLIDKVRRDYVKWSMHPERHPGFPTKRMNRPVKRTAKGVASWSDILATGQDNEVPVGTPCVVGVDYAKTTDFVSVTRLHRIDGEMIGHHHSWWCTNSCDADRVKFPLSEVEGEHLEIVDKVEIPPEFIADYVARVDSVYPVMAIGIDSYRFTLLRAKLAEHGYFPKREGGIVELLRPSNLMMIQPVVESWFVNRKIRMGDDRLWRWFANNTILEPGPNNCEKYGKQDPHARKTDGFMSFVHAACVLPEEQELAEPELEAPIVW